MSAESPVHFALAPPDGFEAWDEAAWDAWLGATPPLPSQRLASRGDWLIFLYMARVHAPAAMGAFAPFLERLMNERPIASAEVSALLHALDAVARGLALVPAAKLWTGTQFYSADELHRLVVEAEARTGRQGTALRVVDLWTELVERLDAVVTRAAAEGRGVWFGET